MKTHFELKDNIIDKTFNTLDLEFEKRTNILNLTQDIKKIVGKFFTNGDLSKAKTLLEGEVS